MKSQHWREVFRGNNAGLGNQMDFGFDRVGVTMKLLARLGNRKKTGPGEYEQIDACSSAGLKKSGDLVFCKKDAFVYQELFIQLGSDVSPSSSGQDKYWGRWHF